MGTLYFWYAVSIGCFLADWDGEIDSDAVLLFSVEMTPLQIEQLRIHIVSLSVYAHFSGACVQLKVLP